MYLIICKYTINTKQLYANLGKNDLIHVLLLFKLSGVSQVVWWKCDFIELRLLSWRWHGEWK